MTINKWSWLRTHCGADKFYDKIAHRKVNFEKRNDDVTMEKLEKFISTVKGNSYNCGLDKLLFRSDTLAKTVGADDNDQRDFFCSELVAKTFKVLGIIEDDDISCTSYVPGHFDHYNDKIFKLTKDTSLDRE